MGVKEGHLRCSNGVWHPELLGLLCHSPELPFGKARPCCHWGTIVLGARVPKLSAPCRSTGSSHSNCLLSVYN